MRCPVSGTLTYTQSTAPWTPANRSLLHRSGIPLRNDENHVCGKSAQPQHVPVCIVPLPARRTVGQSDSRTVGQSDSRTVGQSDSRTVGKKRCGVEGTSGSWWYHRRGSIGPSVARLKL